MPEVAGRGFRAPIYSYLYAEDGVILRLDDDRDKALWASLRVSYAELVSLADGYVRWVAAHASDQQALDGDEYVRADPDGPYNCPACLMPLTPRTAGRTQATSYECQDCNIWVDVTRRA